MKQTAIINGKRYNTETATGLATASHGHAGDFHRYNETLFRTKNGQYFLAGEGGAGSRYGCPVGLNAWSGGARIIPLSQDEAAQWLEREKEYGILEREFPEYVQDA